MLATIYGILGGALSAVLVGVPTDVIPTTWFTRMTPVRAQDYVFLVLTALLGAALGASYARPRTASCPLPQGKTFGGGLLSAFAIGCPICNKLVVLLLGVSGALTYFEPLQPFLGVASLVLLALAVWTRWRPVAALPVTA